MAPSNGECVQDTDISFDMERLFDLYNFDHIPTEKRLSLFKQRDLAHVKRYKTAVKIFGGPSKRTRVHIAPPMETLLKHRLGFYQEEFEPPSNLPMNGQPKPPPVRLETEETIVGKAEEEKAYVTHYNNLIAERKQLRSYLDNLLPDETYLARKINKSEIEKRVLAQYRAHRIQKLEEIRPTPKLHPGIPYVAVTSLNGIQILDMFLSQNHMRLMDLFRRADKNKNQSLTRQEILSAVTQTDHPLTEADVDAMFVMLDADLKGKLSYQAFNKGLQLWHKQKRFTKSQTEGKTKKALSIKNTLEGSEIRPTSSRAATASNLRRKAHSKGLTPDKHTFFGELSGVIKVGYKPIDDHCLESTLGGETADVVNQFRQDKLKEYFSIKKLFEQRGLPLTQKFLDRVTLYPGDQSLSELKQTTDSPVGQFTDQTHPFTKIRSVRGNANNWKVTYPDKKSGFTSSSYSHLKRNIDDASNSRDEELPQRKTLVNGHEQTEIPIGQGYLTVQGEYPSSSSVVPKVHKENFISGQALISRKVDSRMTFQNYNKHTQRRPKRFHNIHNKGKAQATWPSYLSNKLRLCMDSDLVPAGRCRRPLESRDSSDGDGYHTGICKDRGNAVFQYTAQPKRAYPGYNNDLLTWPVGENGVRYGNIDEHRLVK
ncbi:unnamed protein product [Candidula unifasciata]|uniref:EF-hand domain-containing protein n=1 Tax=Candidula unifasciata TaxID=100452 RepID=A0A8S4ABR7_9EUPU|nr:unnamed protein product [Candidula unifasciata]